MRITQNSTRLIHLIKDVRARSLVPAAFQRPYVWSRTDVSAMVNSVLKGYPIGAFVVWTPAPSEKFEFGKARLGPISPADGEKPGGLLLDGQNRLATFAWLMRDWDDSTALPDDLTEHELAVWGSGQVPVIDLEHQRFEFIDAADADKGMRLPAKVLTRDATTQSMVRTRWDTLWAGYSDDAKNDGLRWLDKCENAFSDASVVVTALEYATVAEAKEAFMAVCRTGVPMSEEDFDAALRWGELDPVEQATDSDAESSTIRHAQRS